MERSKRVHPSPMPPTEKLGDLVDVLQRIAKKRTALQYQMREAILAGDDAKLKTVAKELVGLKDQ
jgi:hypothetical protein